MSDGAQFILEHMIESSRQKDYPTIKQDDYFEIFASSQALKLLRFSPDPAEIESGIVGGGSDGGVDGFYFFVNRKLVREDTDIAQFKGQQLGLDVVIIQAKNKASFEESVPQKFERFTRDCLALGTDLSPVEKKILYKHVVLPTNLDSQGLVF